MAILVGHPHFSQPVVASNSLPIPACITGENSRCTGDHNLDDDRRHPPLPPKETMVDVGDWHFWDQGRRGKIRGMGLCHRPWLAGLHSPTWNLKKSEVLRCHDSAAAIQPCALHRNVALVFQVQKWTQPTEWPSRSDCPILEFSQKTCPIEFLVQWVWMTLSFKTSISSSFWTEHDFGTRVEEKKSGTPRRKSTKMAVRLTCVQG